MNCPDCSNRLDDYLDGELAAPDVLAMERHLAECADCRARLASQRALCAATMALPHDVAPPHDLWPAISAHLAQRAADGRDAGGDRGSGRMGAARVPGERPRAAKPDGAGTVLRWLVPLAIAAAVALLAGVAQHHFAAQTRPRGWTVASLAGTPRVNSSGIESSGRLQVGQWLETDARSRARVVVGEIGEVSVEPNSRVRLVDASAQEHRLELARGTLNALIWAPPRLFFVNTPSATAVDLGCAYTLRVDDDGGGELSVTAGYVALEHGDREAIIPYGMMCLTRPGFGPGTPFSADAAPELRVSLAAFDFDSSRRTPALRDVLGRATAADAITLWHLLGRAMTGERGEIFDALARHHAPPPGVTRAGIVTGDPAMRAAWAAELGLHVVRQP